MKPGGGLLQRYCRVRERYKVMIFADLAAKAPPNPHLIIKPPSDTVTAETILYVVSGMKHINS
jgi:hypothetical protein